MAASLVVAGSGPWAQRHMATISKTPGLRLAGVISNSLASENRPLIDGIEPPNVWRNAEELLAEGYRPDGLVIVVPPPDMRKLVIPLLDAQIPVFVEKPLGISAEEARLMVERATNRNIPIMVNFIHLFSTEYRALRQKLPSIGALRHIESRGGNSGPDRTYISALWDYGPHDLAYALDLLGHNPKSVSAHVVCGDERNHVVNVKLGYPDGRSATLEFGNQMPVKVRRLICQGTEGFLQLDDHPAPCLSVSGSPVPLESDTSPLEAALQEFAAVTAGGEDTRETAVLAVRVNELLDEIAEALW